MEEEKKQFEQNKFEEYVFATFPDCDLAGLRRIRKYLKKLIADRNWEVRWEKRIARLSAQEVDALLEQVQARAKKLKAA